MTEYIVNTLVFLSIVTWRRKIFHRECIETKSRVRNHPAFLHALPCGCAVNTLFWSHHGKKTVWNPAPSRLDVSVVKRRNETRPLSRLTLQGSKKTRHDTRVYHDCEKVSEFWTRFLLIFTCNLMDFFTDFICFRQLTGRRISCFLLLHFLN